MELKWQLLALEGDCDISVPRLQDKPYRRWVILGILRTASQY